MKLIYYKVPLNLNNIKKKLYLLKFTNSKKKKQNKYNSSPTKNIQLRLVSVKKIEKSATFQNKARIVASPSCAITETTR